MLAYFTEKEEKTLDEVMRIACRLRESIIMEYENDTTEENRLKICAIDLICDIIPKIYHTDKFDISKRYNYEIFEYALVLKIYHVLLSINLEHEDWCFDNMNKVIHSITSRIFIEYLM